MWPARNARLHARRRCEDTPPCLLMLAHTTGFTGFLLKPVESNPVDPVEKAQRHSVAPHQFLRKFIAFLMPSGAYHGTR
jgi:hypothetical protein